MKNEQKPNYQILFIMGITFTGAGIAIGMAPMIALGFTFMLIGLIKRSDWPDRKNQDSGI